MTAILASEATLSTLQVSIQALVVNGKQMTLAVFRQLPNVSPVDADGNLQEFNYWGLVRYAIKDQGDVWGVATIGSALVRCAIRDPNDLQSSIAWRRREYEEGALKENRYRGEKWRERTIKDFQEVPRLENQRTAMRRLMLLPQLFIAV